MSQGSFLATGVWPLELHHCRDAMKLVVDGLSKEQKDKWAHEIATCLANHHREKVFHDNESLGDVIRGAWISYTGADPNGYDIDTNYASKLDKSIEIICNYLRSLPRLPYYRWDGKRHTRYCTEFEIAVSSIDPIFSDDVKERWAERIGGILSHDLEHIIELPNLVMRIRGAWRRAHAWDDDPDWEIKQNAARNLYGNARIEEAILKIAYNLIEPDEQPVISK